MGDFDTRFDYLTDPARIYDLSFERIRTEVDLSRFPGLMARVVERMVHASADPTIVNDLIWSQGAADAGRIALADGAKILVDAEMVARGIIQRELPRNNEIICTLNADGVSERAQASGETRTMAALADWHKHIGGAVVVIGNAPTALFRLLEMLADGAPKPALILGFPVGFVGATESKAALIAHAGAIPYITLTGRRGGSAMAAAALNAIAIGETP